MMFIVIKTRGGTVRLGDSRRQGAVLQPLRGADVAFSIHFLHPVAHVVIGKGGRVTQWVDTAGQQIVFIPLVTPALTTFVNKTRDKPLRVPVMLARLAVVLRDRRQACRQIVSDAAAIAGTGAVFHHAPVIEFLPAIFTLQPAG